VVFGLCHHQLRSLILKVVGTVPVDDHAINAAADHVINLTLDLRGIGGVVADIHVRRIAKPQEQVSIDFRRRAGI